MVVATPADVEGPLPLVLLVDDQAAAAADAGVVEQEVDAVGILVPGDGIAEATNLDGIGDVGDVRGDALALAKPIGHTEPLCLLHRRGRDVAERDVAALRDQQPRQLATHSRAAAGDDRDPACKILHAPAPP